ncbi:MAG: alanine racemase [Oscillospiraceae bacterium]|nr:alanine racemase [Oscillospiraceae bacterium]
MNSNHKYHDYHRSFACIDLDAIKSNFDSLKSRVPSSVKTMAVVKANAYGHGAIRVAKALEKKADYFAVAVIEEAIELRDGGIKNPILILSYTSPYQFEALINNELIPSVYRYEDAEMLSQEACRLGKTAVIHIAVDTGMSRIGFKDSEKSADTVKKISELPNIRVEGIFSHFACADAEDKACALGQKKRFDNFIAMLEERGLTIPVKHICNSASIIDFDFSYDMVRMGISLYGLYPSDEVKKDSVSLTPAMEVVSHIIHIKEIEAGTGVGYGHIYIAPEKRKIATVCIGYADGFNRAFSNKGYVLINGKKAPITGKVCMDQIMVDITDIKDAKIGDHVIIMGSSNGETITAEQLGQMCESFNYEVVCTFMPRVMRLYYENGELSD